ncbi:MAG TPA: hypothetical protein VNY24_20595 [Candidatus Acidoferrales bacterium]|nr:hypothetical protein [Candidatus Acidoferrales bacterium]
MVQLSTDGGDKSGVAGMVIQRGVDILDKLSSQFVTCKEMEIQPSARSKEEPNQQSRDWQSP